TLHAELEFGYDQERRRVVQGKVTAELSLECQRCLEPMAFSIEADVNWAVVWDEEKAKQLPSRLEPWIAGEEAEDLYAMIEEELLLALPTAPLHTELCIESSLLSSGDEELVDSDTEKTNNPFQALAALKGNSSKKDQKN
ncbi:MAG TPA: YceD family protein, partial [Marinagarivorans sp.]